MPVFKQMPSVESQNSPSLFFFFWLSTPPHSLPLLVPGERNCVPAGEGTDSVEDALFQALYLHELAFNLLMGEGDVKTEGQEHVTKSSENEAQAEVVDEKKEKENGVKEMEEHSKDNNSRKESDKTGIDEEIKGKMEEDRGASDEEAKMEQVKEEPKAEAMEEEKSLDEQEKKPENLEDKGLTEKLAEKENGDEKEAPQENVEQKQEGGEREEAKETEEKEEQVTESQEEEGEAMKSNEEKGSKKRTRGKSIGELSVEKKKKVGEKEQGPRTPTSNRPVRERKSVERLVSIIEKDTTREFHIEKGSGMLLKDIPNVAYKLSRRKGDETFKLLHTILYGRRGKAVEIKHNISRFSGFVWRENEEKQKMKVKEKLDKCVKEKLLELCDVLDIPVTKATSKKEDIVAKLLDFLVAPHATTTVLLAEKDQGKKRKRDVGKGASKSPNKRSSKSQKKIDDASKKDEKKSVPETDDDSDAEEEREEGKDDEEENKEVERSEDEDSGESSSEGKKEESEEDTVNEKRQSGRRNQESKKIQKTESSEKATSKKNTSKKKSSSSPNAAPKKSSPSHSKVDKCGDTIPKVFSRKKKGKEPEKGKPSASKKSTPKEKSGKIGVRGKEKSKAKEEKLKPGDDELRTAICDILKEVDFNTATFTDILKQLAKQFNTDLAPRRSSIKLMIQDELTKLAEEADDEEDEDDGDAEKDEAQPAAEEVDA